MKKRKFCKTYLIYKDLQGHNEEFLPALRTESCIIQVLRNKNQGLTEALRSLRCIDKLQLTEQTSVATTNHPSGEKILVLTPGLQRTKLAQKFIFARIGL